MMYSPFASSFYRETIKSELRVGTPYLDDSLPPIVREASQLLKCTTY